jgi:DNA topoisomerase-1
LDPRGRPVRDPATLARIRALAIPPAWRDVWISPHASGHIQATGRDARGRKQYRYHAKWTAARDEDKYHRVLDFAHALPAIRRRTQRDMLSGQLSRARVLATVVRLLESTLIRVGNDEYARTNGSFGLTTLQDRHARVRGRSVTFRFRAKSGVFQTVDLDDPVLARSVKLCQDLPGQTLFQYLDENGRRRRLTSNDVNLYLREIAGEEFTAKDFRTWVGTVLAAKQLRRVAPAGSTTARTRQIVAAVDEVAKRLRNTRAVCRRCYVHPGVVDAFHAGTIVAANGTGPRPRGLTADEAAVLALLTRQARRLAAAS